MKFLKDINGDFVRIDKIVAFEAAQTTDSCCVQALCDEIVATLKYFDTEAEARSWLGELMIQVEDELSGRNLTRDIFNHVMQLTGQARHVEN